jgi:hypothetical protein
VDRAGSDGEVLNSPASGTRIAVCVLRFPVPRGGDHGSGVFLRYGLSYRDVEELLAERGVQVDHVTVYR